MNRAVATILGLFLFCTGLFLGMVGSFFGTLPVESPRHAAKSEKAIRAVATVTQLPPDDMTKPPVREKTSPPPEDPSESVESALVDALRMLATALTSQPAATPPQLPAPPPAELASTALAPVTDTPAEPAPAPASEPATAPLSPPPVPGHWAYDAQIGWLWMPEGAPAMVFVPAVEVYPGGFVTIRPGSRRGPPSRRATAPPPQTTPSSSVTDPIVPGSRRAPAWSPFSNSVKNREDASSQRPRNSVIESQTPGSKRLPAWSPETRK